MAGEVERSGGGSARRSGGRRTPSPFEDVSGARKALLGIVLAWVGVAVGAAVWSVTASKRAVLLDDLMTGILFAQFLPLLGVGLGVAGLAVSIRALTRATAPGGLTRAAAAVSGGGLVLTVVFGVFAFLASLAPNEDAARKRIEEYGRRLGAWMDRNGKAPERLWRLYHEREPDIATMRWYEERSGYKFRLYRDKEGGRAVITAFPWRAGPPVWAVDEKGRLRSAEGDVKEPGRYDWSAVESLWDRMREVDGSE